MSDYDSDGSVFSIGDSPAKPKAASAAAKSKAKASGNGKSSSAAKRDGPSVEEIYQKKTPLEHVLLRPDTYIGSVEPIEEELWVMDLEKNRMVQRKIKFTPGLYKIVDEILVNAADNKARDPTMRKIDITIDRENGVISIMNDGKGIPVEIHKDQN
ncbi:DNA topoisomerase 2-beta, partial [Coemansia sp. RSA 2598]